MRKSSLIYRIIGYALLVLVVAIVAPGSSDAAQTATLTLTPSTRSIAVGDVFKVEILVDTGGNPVDGVDIHYLNYNPQYLEVQDADASVAGVQIKPGSVFPATMTNNVDPVKGRIDFSQITRAGEQYNGSGILATITFKVVGVDTPDVLFDFSPGDTTDTNVASGGTDVLASVAGARFTNTGGTSQTPGDNGGVTAPLPPPGGGGGGGGTTTVVLPPQAGTETELGVIVIDEQGQSCLSPRFRNPLFPGVEGQIVQILQKFLNSQGHTLANSGPGSVGQESEFYGNITSGGVRKFQCAEGIVCTGTEASTGYGLVGPMTRNKLNEVVIATKYVDCGFGTSFVGAFDRNLTIGSRGEDVRRLQQVLNQQGFVVSSTGPGSPGQETDYFGSLTVDAVRRYQNANAAQILTPVGLTQGTGFFGPSTRNHLNR